MFSRRNFLTGIGATALVAGLQVRRAEAVVPPTQDLKALVELGIDAALAGGAGWADVRFERIQEQSIYTRDDHLVHAGDSQSLGLGIRVIVDGVWGFAASWRTDRDSVIKTARDALSVAKANAMLGGRRVELAPVAKALGHWSSPFQIDPFTVPLEEKVEALLAASRAALAVKGAKSHVTAYLTFVSQEKTIGNSEGSFFVQRNLRGQPGVYVTVVDEARGEFEEADTGSLIPPAQVGFECLKGGHLERAAVRSVEAAMGRLGATPVEAGTYDLVLAPSNLWLTIHESIGHPLELDRILGYEANFAGTSFVRVADLGALNYGSPLLNIVADRTQKGGLATVGWDDDGQPGDSWDLIKQGKLVGVQTTREQASWIGQEGGHSGDFAQSWSAPSFQRMPNVSLQPGRESLTPEQLIADTRRGIYVEGNGSWSIDHQRYNFQFGGQAFTLIENGKLTRPLRYVAYQSNTLDFWQSMDAICDARDYYLGGTLADGKGEPAQSNPVSHGCVTSRFRNVRVLNVRA
jgi:TldD protein